MQYVNTKSVYSRNSFYIHLSALLPPKCMLLTKDRSRENHARLVGLIDEALAANDISARQASLDVVGHTNLISGIKAGKMPSFDRMEALFEYLGLHLTYGAKPVASGFADSANSHFGSPDPGIYLPLPWLSSMPGSTGPANVGFRRDWLINLDAKIENLALFLQPDDGLRPKHPKDTVFLIDKAGRPTTTIDLFAVRINGRVKMRFILRPSARTLFVLKNETDREPEILEGAEVDRYIIQGRAIWAGAPIN